MAARVRGTQGYEEQAAELVQRYEALDFADKHRDVLERIPATATDALDGGGVLLMSIRHGAVPAGRVMFDVSAEETIALAASCGLDCVASVHGESIDARNRAAGVTWPRLAFRRRGAASLH